MKMSKAHFEALARALRECKIEGNNSALAQWEVIVCKIADVCAVPSTTPADTRGNK